MLVEFIMWASPKNNVYYRISIGEENGREGGLSDAHIGDSRFQGSKLYTYDGESRGNVSDWKGLVICEHLSMRSQVAGIYLFANHLERFLRERRIPYERFGIRVSDRQEEEQTVAN
jgi:hypothetical protein